MDLTSAFPAAQQGHSSSLDLVELLERALWAARAGKRERDVLPLGHLLAPTLCDVMVCAPGGLSPLL